ncbi:probable DNA replication complex GINS protein PSF1 [Ricinus communis]|nr:probable DNA replication complex GINS protein PSF1 [Ricinus communis]XP_015573789.1 probable DNA replication complex GINS protein PSF1 [Ricinus communis]XP_015573790.1 probable DNA replication complex GINS protein PSF1 [Ricinus communis]XP_048234451.1 probable DNA replication complex GINS protein PSF1 [Ricinus communis]|eukprot:XP_015573788.1 probable DNA replication complex GINS protein PSF1 [Ricinus communis]
MYAKKGYELVKEFSSGEKGQLQAFNEDLFHQVIGQCGQHYLELQALIRKMQEESVDVAETRNADHYGALTHHLSLIRNKRCLMAYVYNRAEIIRNLAWKVGFELLELPEEIQEKLNHSEKNYYGKHSAALQSYMAEIGIDLNVDMVPPKDPYIKVRVLSDMGEGILLSDKTANLSRHSMHFLKRTDAEQYIARGMMEELTS